MRKLRNRETLRRPSRYVQDYGYKHGPHGIPDYVRSIRRKKQVEQHRASSPVPPPSLSPIPITTLPPPPPTTVDCIRSSTEKVTAHHVDNEMITQHQPMEVQPYVPRGEKVSISLHGIYMQRAGEEQLFVRGESIKVDSKSGVTYVGALQDIQMCVSFGSQILLELRPYYTCRELDPYTTEMDRELCIQTPNMVITVDASQAMSITKLYMHHNSTESLPEDPNHFRLYRVYNKDTKNWLPLETALRQERLQRQQQQQPQESETTPIQQQSHHEDDIFFFHDTEEEDDDDETNVLTPELLLLKRSFESDFGTIGFLDFLVQGKKGTGDALCFSIFLSKEYLEPLLHVGSPHNTMGTNRFIDAIMNEDYRLEYMGRNRLKHCYFCGVCTQCNYVLQPVGKSVSSGCAARFNITRQIECFIIEHGGTHPHMELSELYTLHRQLLDLLYRADRCLQRPIREQNSL